jgi:hypothetical protein
VVGKEHEVVGALDEAAPHELRPPRALRVAAQQDAPPAPAQLEVPRALVALLRRPAQQGELEPAAAAQGQATRPAVHDRAVVRQPLPDPCGQRTRPEARREALDHGPEGTGVVALAVGADDRRAPGPDGPQPGQQRLPRHAAPVAGAAVEQPGPRPGGARDDRRPVPDLERVDREPRRGHVARPQRDEPEARTEPGRPPAGRAPQDAGEERRSPGGGQQGVGARRQGQRRPRPAVGGLEQAELDAGQPVEELLQGRDGQEQPQPAQAQEQRQRREQEQRRHGTHEAPLAEGAPDHRQGGQAGRDGGAQGEARGAQRAPERDPQPGRAPPSEAVDGEALGGLGAPGARQPRREHDQPQGGEVAELHREPHQGLRRRAPLQERRRCPHRERVRSARTPRARPLRGQARQLGEREGEGRAHDRGPAAGEGHEGREQERAPGAGVCGEGGGASPPEATPEATGERREQRARGPDPEGGDQPHVQAGEGQGVARPGAGEEVPESGGEPRAIPEQERRREPAGARVPEAVEARERRLPRAPQAAPDAAREAAGSRRQPAQLVGLDALDPGRRVDGGERSAGGRVGRGAGAQLDELAVAQRAARHLEAPRIARDAAQPLVPLDERAPAPGRDRRWAAARLHRPRQGRRGPRARRQGEGGEGRAPTARRPGATAEVGERAARDGEQGRRQREGREARDEDARRRGRVADQRADQEVPGDDGREGRQERTPRGRALSEGAPRLAPGPRPAVFPPHRPSGLSRPRPLRPRPCRPRPSRSRPCRPRPSRPRPSRPRPSRSRPCRPRTSRSRSLPIPARSLPGPCRVSARPPPGSGRPDLRVRSRRRAPHPTPVDAAGLAPPRGNQRSGR